ncbi:unnamed protein product [Mytilus coruscus]|uniref:Uncharacterized protein n=1 Tax=Mytilus coruscus TaxID=42192 RepID=A0A6J8C2T9_MYTCO|nr:unnamed protein product [Mytilus coruscus]
MTCVEKATKLIEDIQKDLRDDKEKEIIESTDRETSEKSDANETSSNPEEKGAPAPTNMGDVEVQELLETTSTECRDLPLLVEAVKDLQEDPACPKGAEGRPPPSTAGKQMVQQENHEVEKIDFDHPQSAYILYITGIKDVKKEKNIPNFTPKSVKASIPGQTLETKRTFSLAKVEKMTCKNCARNTN